MIFLEKLSAWLNKNSIGKIALLFFLIFIVFTATVLPKQSKRAETYSAEVGSVDLSLWYSADDVYEMAEAYGEIGRQEYIKARLTFDVLWPIIYMLFLITSISYIFSNAFPANSNLKKLNLIPIAALIFDYFENSLAAIFMAQFPNRNLFISSILPVFTLFKWIFVAGSFAIVLYGLGVLKIKTLKKLFNIK